MTKEEIYDEQISPLITRVIRICKENKIANVMSFSLDLEEGLCCTTCMTEDDFEPPEKFRECVKLLFPPKINPLFVTITKGDGSKEITAIM